MNSSKDDPRAKQLSTGKKKFNIDPGKVGYLFNMFFLVCSYVTLNSLCKTDNSLQQGAHKCDHF